MNSRRETSLTLLAIAAVLVLATSSTGTYGGGCVINVPADQPTIQAAIDAAVDGCEVVVAPGTYNEAIDFIGKAINLHSSDGPDVTTIDASGLNTSVVSCVNRTWLIWPRQSSRRSSVRSRGLIQAQRETA